MEISVMKRILTVLVVILVGILFCDSAIATVMSFDLIDLGSGSFEYLYTIENDTLQVSIEQFTIWFDEQLYDNLQVTTQTPLANDWGEIILPSTGFGVPLGYDALELAGGIGLGQSVEGFSVSFDWLGMDLPGSQPFEIVNPLDSQPIDSGNTVPEPTTILFFAIGGLILRRNQRSR